MKKMILLFLVFAFGTAPLVHARTPIKATVAEDAMDASFWIGYTSTFLRGLNEELDDWRSMLDAVGYSNNLKVTHGDGAINMGANLDLPITKNLKAGPRLGLLLTLPAEARGERLNASYHYDWTTSIGATMMTLAGGMVYTVWNPGPYFSLDLGMDMGLALVFAGWKSTMKTDDPNWDLTPYNYDIPLSGSCLYVNLNTSAKYHFEKDKAAFLRLGYRISDMDYLTIGKEYNNIIPFNDIRAGNPFRGVDDDPIAFDLSGFEFSVGFELSF